MHHIHMAEVSEEFARCWQAAGIHIQNQAQGGLHSWLRAHLNPPFLEHLSFRLGNQLFFIQLQDVDDVLEIPGHLGGLLSVADGCQGHALEKVNSNKLDELLTTKILKEICHEK